MINRGPELNRMKLAVCINKFKNDLHMKHVKTLKERYGLKRREVLLKFAKRRSGIVPVVGATRNPREVQRKGSGTSSADIDSVGDLSREGLKYITTSDRGMGRDTPAHSLSPNQSVGGIVTGCRRRRKFKTGVFRISSN